MLKSSCRAFSCGLGTDTFGYTLKTIKKAIVKNTIVFLRISAYNIFNKSEMEAIDMRETRTLEFKETITNTFLKTVSAFSNYDGGTILLV